ncbi:uncharacterized protein LOC131257999 isoform X2 [Magnolia sinica]|uniref:uncharacterized protein LOC131257999 isoform X2 n=1 Tax=Magnolia sinica TaxID=86752 RepID=UPI0026580372|nr:uncharacterized protein LOC131257999 isoform X2 [Magnolia sinica]
MGCSFSGLNALYDAVNGGGDVWINENRFRIVRQLGEGGFAYVYLVKEVTTDGSAADTGSGKKFKDSSHVSDDGTYAMKKVLIQNNEQLELVRQEIRLSSLFNHPNLLPLLDHAIIAVKGAQEGSRNHEAYLLFPVHLDGTLLDNAKVMKDKKEFFSTINVLQIFRQEWAAEHCSAPFRAPELWDCPSHADIDERTDIWSLGCTLYAIMYGESPFEYVLGESGGSLQLAVMNAQIKWPTGPNPPYPEPLHQFVTWMLQTQVALRPRIDDIIIHVDKLISKYSA